MAARTTRAVCIIAHVDHGKTTIADSLLASNGIVSHRLAGLGLRYMDSREDEQDRGITMKASCIALSVDSDEDGVSQRSTVNLIDSPGHIDFCGEVSAAARLSDGALLVVDAVEGVCVQTHAVLKQAWEEHVVPVLVLNKIDRLITELQLSPLEAWHHMKNVVQQVNAIAGHLYAGAVLEAESRAYTSGAGSAGEGEDVSAAVDERLPPRSDDGATTSEVGELQFAPERGNVLFASAVHGWAFGLRDFAELYSSKLGMRKEVLQQTLWGEYFFSPKAKKIVSSCADGKLKPMFVQFVLQTLWHVYQAVLVEPDETQRDKIVATLGLTVPARELRHADPVVQLRAIMGQWLPLGRNVLRTMVEKLPCAADSQAARLEHLCPQLGSVGEGVGGARVDGDGVTEPATEGTEQPRLGGCEVGSASALVQLRRAAETCDASAAAPILLHIAKMVYVAEVPGAHADDTFVGFARVFSGCLQPGEGGTLYMAGADGMPATANAIAVDGLRLYTLMGRELVPTTHVGAGCVCGVGGLGDFVVGSATLSSVSSCPPFVPLSMQGSPIMQVALEPQQLGGLPHLAQGLQLLARADASVVVAQLPTGEHVVSTCGEVHLERCMHDLRTTFAPGLELVVSPPIVSLRESIAQGACGRGEASTSNKQARLTIRALGLPDEVVSRLTEQSPSLRLALQSGHSWIDSGQSTDETVGRAIEAVATCVADSGRQWQGLVPLSVAPLSSCANLLLCSPAVRDQLQSATAAAKLLPSILSGFQHAASSGPLCEEPMSGVAFVVDELYLTADDEEGIGGGELEGQAIVAAKEACRSAFLACSTRVLEPVYLCELQTTQDSMRKTYSVLSRRRAQILSEDLKEGTPIFTIQAHLPVVESMGFATDLRKNTSGAAHPQLVFSHFETLPQDPLFTVTSEEDQEALDDGDIPTVNLARKLMDDVRRRKGLRVEEKAVQSATKQRTLARKK